MPTSNFRTSGPDGFSVSGLKIVDPPVGNVFWVDSTRGADGNEGTHDHPLATLDAALSKCSANNQDIIYLDAGHAETLSAAGDVDIDVAGVRIIGVGRGNARPSFTLAATAATFTVTADNCLLHNVRFLMGADASVVLPVAAKYFHIDSCEFLGNATYQWVKGITLSGAANVCDGFLATRLRMVSDTAGSSSAIETDYTGNDVTISHCFISGDYSDAGINGTSNIITNFSLLDSDIRNVQTGDHAVQLVSAYTGTMARNTYYSDIVAPGGVDPGSCASFECYHCDAINVSGILAPLAT